MIINVIKRDGAIQGYESFKIKNAIRKAMVSVDIDITEQYLDDLLEKIEKKIEEKYSDSITVENIQDFIEQTLVEANQYKAVKSFILYRENRTKLRNERCRLAECFKEYDITELLQDIQHRYDFEEYPLSDLYGKFIGMIKPGISDKEKLSLLIKSAVELTSQEKPKWEMISGMLLFYEFMHKLSINCQGYGIKNFYEKIKFLTESGLYGEYILDNYSKDEIDDFEKYINENRTYLMNYSGLELLLKRYIITTHSGKSMETPQEMFMGVAMHLGMMERKEVRSEWVKRFYDMLSTLKVTVATPTLANARKPYHQLSSCFIDTIPDSLDGIYRSIDNFAKVSKFGGGMGLYFGKIRANGSPIRGFEGAAGGVIRWIRLANDTAVAVDQLGVRQGSVAVYLDVWHKDLPEFLSLRTNNGDDRMKAHDVFPAVCYPDYFWQQVKENIEGDWYLMCPHEIMKVKGYCIEDSFGEEWTEKYLDCVADFRISKRVIPIKDIVRMIIKSSVETGTPFTFNRDVVNRSNPNGHKGMIYCSNLCTEIAQNMSPIEAISEEIVMENGDVVIVSKTKPGDFVVCNLASLSLGKIDMEKPGELEFITESAMRALDNVIDLNMFPVPYAKVNNERYRPVGLGVSGYHHLLAKKHIKWESEEHLEYIDKLFERIDYAAISASCKNAEEKGRYDYFEGSDWDTGAYFDKRKLTDDKWKELRTRIKEVGIRNGYLLAVAPTGSTSIISGTSAGIDPIMNRYFLEEKKSGLLPRVAPDLSQETFWYYKNAHSIDQGWSIRACGIRQRYIDQGQSMNIYITNEFSYRQVLDLFIMAWEKGVKTIYYIRSKSLEVEQCESCSS